MNFDKAKKMIALDEGLRLKPYKCTAGRWTIGLKKLRDCHTMQTIVFLWLANGTLEND